MKNVILGIITTILLIYTTVICLSVYSIYVRKNQVEKCLAFSLQSAMDRYFMPTRYNPGRVAVDEAEVEAELINDLEERLNSDCQVNTVVYVCDMEKGIISAEVEESFYLPMGILKTIGCRKTVIVDREESENDK